MDTINYFSLWVLIKCFFTSQITPAQLVEWKLGSNTFYTYGFDFVRHALFQLFKLKKWQRIGLPSFTCPIIYEAIVSSGAKPVVIDVNLSDFNIDITKIKDKHLDALVVVHTFGNLVDIKKLKSEFSKLTIIEDCAHLDPWKRRELIADFRLLSLYKMCANVGGALLLSKERLIFPKLSPALPFRLSDVFRVQELAIMTRFIRRFLPLPNYSVGNVVDGNAVANLWLQMAIRVTKLERKDETAKLYAQHLNKELFDFNFNPQLNYNFSVLLKFGDNLVRDKFLSFLRQKGIFLGRQWYNTAHFGQHFGKHVAEHIVNLPVNVRMSKQKLLQAIRIINKVAYEIKLHSKI